MLVVLYAVITMVPLAWIFLTGFKSGPDSIAYPPRIVFTPSTEGYCNLFTTRSRQTPEYVAQLPPATGVCDAHARVNNMVIVGPSNYPPRFINSLIIAFGSTALSVVAWRDGGVRVFAIQGTGQGRSPVLHPVDADDAADRGGHPDLSHVPRGGAFGYAPGNDPPVHGGQRFARRLAAQRDSSTKSRANTRKRR